MFQCSWAEVLMVSEGGFSASARRGAIVEKTKQQPVKTSVGRYLRRVPRSICDDEEEEGG